MARKNSVKQNTVKRLPHSPGARIYKAVRGNPKKEGTKAAAKWNLYRNGMTVEQYLARGGRRSTLHWDEKRGLIRIEE